MSELFARTELLMGEAAVEELSHARVAVFGIGGVGGYICEGLARSGIGALDIIDNDTVDISNINRQIIATNRTIGRYKTDVMKERLLDINPDIDVVSYKCFCLPENIDQFPFDRYDYVADAVDTITAKIAIITKCKSMNIPVISAMGAGNKLDPTGFKVADIYDTAICPLSKVMRRELRKRNVGELKVVYSQEMPVKLTQDTRCPGSVSFVPPVVGFIMAGEIIKDLAAQTEKRTDI